MKSFKRLILLSFLLYQFNLFGQIVPVGSGSYTTQFPGKDEAGRNNVPPGPPQLSGSAASKPAPTNDWWSPFVIQGHATQTFNYPLSYRSENEGLVINYTWPSVSGPNSFNEAMSAVDGLKIGVQGLSATKSTIANHTDWTVTANWNGAGKDFSATMGVGMPFTYFTKGSSDVAQVIVGHFAEGASVSGNKIIIKDNYGFANYVVYAPAGSTWTKNGGTFTSTLNGKNYWSIALLPFNGHFGQTIDINTVAAEYEKYAFVFPGNTEAQWSYNASNGVVTTNFIVTPDVKEGVFNTFLQGLLPHQWSRLAAGSPTPAGYSYRTVRGELKTLASNTFSVANKFSGVLPNLPNLAKYSQGFDIAALSKKIDAIKGKGLSGWTDSYNQGMDMSELIQAAHIANQIGNIPARDQLINTVRERLEDWLTVESGEVAFLFYYHPEWKTMIGYPAGHNQDKNLNDHHFHWGYFIHAAAAIEQYQPGWKEKWGPMINLLVRDAGSPDRNDPMFPFLRNFSPFAGHAWANGFATEFNGNDQESTSESMQFNTSLIHWGTISGNTQIRDLGIYLYTTEQSAIEEYWFDKNNRTAQPEYAHTVISRIFGNGYDSDVFWVSGKMSAAYGIQLFPMHGGSFYLGHHPDMVEKVWTEMTAKTSILTNSNGDVDLWRDVYWDYLAFINPAKALEMYNAFPGRTIKLGVSDAHTYHWLHTMNAMGQVAEEVTADYPIAAVFNKNGVKTYVAHNYGSSPITVHFSDGTSLTVPAKSTATNRDITANAVLVSDKLQIPTNGTVTLTATPSGSGITKVEFYKDGTLLTTDAAAPYTFTTSALPAALTNFYVKVFAGENLNISNIVTVQVGSQIPFPGPTAPTIPGATIEAGNYDAYEGGIGQGITYSDATSWNEAGYRPTEAVDAGTATGEGITVGWIEPGEWLEYTINVTKAGEYDINLRYASGVTSGGGPFWFENEAGTKISSNVTVASTGNWNTYLDKKVEKVYLPAGTQVIRVKAGSGGFNLGRMSFTWMRDGNIPPTVNITSPAEDASFLAPANIVFNATASDTDGTVTKVEFYNGDTKLGEDLTAPYTFTWSNVAKGDYQITAKAIDDKNGVGSDNVNVSVVSQNVKPVADITSPTQGAVSFEPATFNIAVTASDADGTVSKVEFFNGSTKLGEDATSPYQFTWSNLTVGTYKIKARAIDNVGAFSDMDSVTVSVDPNAKPSIAITSPADNATFMAPANIIINASASDVDGSVTKVEFFNGSTKIGEDFASPYTFTWSNVGKGNYTIKAKATDNRNATRFDSVRVIVESDNLPPTVSITSPANSTSFTAPASITISATATDADGSVSKVEFYNGGTKLGEDLTSPYSFTWSGVAKGSYLLAKAIDNEAAAAYSDTVKVSVIENPICSGVGPNAPGTTTPDYSWTATNTANPTVTFVPGTPIAGCDFAILYVKLNEGGYAGYIMDKSGANFTKSFTAAIGTKVSVYFTYRVSAGGGERNSNAAPGSFTVGQCSSDRNIAPVVSITSPADNSVFAPNSTIAINATASDSDGTVTKVEFFNGTTKLGEDLTAPYTFSWANVAAGTYTIVVKATDDKDAVGSAQVNVSSSGGGCTGTAVNGDYSYEVSTTAGTVKWKFIPLAPIAGSTMSIIYINGAGYTMTAEGTSFTFSRAYTNGQNLSFYFTYRVGNTGMERNSSANPHSYVVGNNCTATRLFDGEYAEEKDSLYPMPAQTSLKFADKFEGAKVVIRNLNGAKVLETEVNDKSIDVSSLQQGVYVIQITNGSTLTTKQLIKN